jgi:RHS repeat-associated protein
VLRLVGQETVKNPCNAFSAIIDPRLVGDPVDTLTGAVFDRELEFRLTGPLELRWYRNYDSSKHNRSFALGFGRTHDFDRVLRFDGDTINYEAPVGRVISFVRPTNDGDERSQLGFVLRRLSSRRYVLFHHGEPATEFELDKSGTLGRLKRLFDGSHQILFHRNGGDQLERIVDSAGRHIAVLEGPGGRLLKLTLEGKGGKPDFVLVANQYDDRGNLVATSNGTGHGHTFAYDKADRLVLRSGRKGFKFRFEYDEQGRCVKSTGDDGLYAVTLEYKVPGRLTKVTNADGGVWTYSFDPFGNLADIQDPLGGRKKFLRDESGRLTVELDENQNATRYVYDSPGEPVAKIDPLGNQIALPEDPNARNPRAHRVAARAVEYEYGRLIDVGSINLPDRAHVRTLPLSGEAKKFVFVSEEAEPETSTLDGQFPVLPLGPSWWPDPVQGRIFNDIGKLVRQHDGFGRTRQWDYDASGNISGHQDFDGGQWSYDYGSWHLLRGITNPLGAKVKVTYTSTEKVASCTDAAGTVSEYRYDLNNHLIEVKRHGIVRDIYARDPAGNLLAKHGGNGRELLRFEIGPGNLKTKRTLASGDEHIFEYDKAGRYLVAATKKDKTEFAYDGFGNRILEKHNGRGVTHRFRSKHRPIETIFLDRFVIHYKRTSHLVITDPGGKSHETRDLSNGIVERTFSNGSREVTQFDWQGRCLFKSVERASGRIWNRRFDWSGEGELRQIQDNHNGDIRHEYDAAHRLRRRFANGGVEDYEFDLADNLLRQPGLDDVTLQEGNRLRAVNGLAVSYNDRNHIAERQTKYGQIRYMYNSCDQLVRVDSHLGQWEAEYDALGRRTRKTLAGQTTEFFWNSDQLVGEIAPNGRLRLYAYADPLAVTPFLFLDYDSIDSPPESGQRFFIFSDQIGTPCLIEDEKAVEVWRARIRPFGHAEVSAEATLEFNLRFPGHYCDGELSLHYNRFRYYDPNLGRYLQSDPWGIAGGTNLYAYRLNPLVEVDVRGLGDEKDKPGPKPAPENPEDDEPTNPNYRPPLRVAVVAAADDAQDMPKDTRPTVLTGMRTPEGDTTTAGSYRGPRDAFNGLEGAPQTQAAYARAAANVSPPPDLSAEDAARFPAPQQAGKCGEAMNMANYERQNGQMPPPGTEFNSALVRGPNSPAHGDETPACPYCSHVGNEQGYDMSSGTSAYKAPDGTVVPAKPATG